jgi:hypothetical protein
MSRIPPVRGSLANWYPMGIGTPCGCHLGGGGPATGGRSPPHNGEGPPSSAGCGGQCPLLSCGIREDPGWCTDPEGGVDSALAATPGSKCGFFAGGGRIGDCCGGRAPAAAVGEGDDRGT